MAYIDRDGGITLSVKEHEITDLLLQVVTEEDMDVPQAAGYVLAALPHPDPVFVHWLSQGAIVPD